MNALVRVVTLVSNWGIPKQLQYFLKFHTLIFSNTDTNANTNANTNADTNTYADTYSYTYYKSLLCCES